MPLTLDTLDGYAGDTTGECPDCGHVYELGADFDPCPMCNGQCEVCSDPARYVAPLGMFVCPAHEADENFSDPDEPTKPEHDYLPRSQWRR